MSGNSRSLIYFTIAGMELCWLYAVLDAAGNSTPVKLYIPLLLGTFIISWASSLLIRYLHWPKPALTSLSWLIWPVIMLLTIKVQLFSGTAFTDTTWLLALPHAVERIFVEFEPALLVLLSSILLWWMGRRMAYINPAFNTAVAEFQFGLFILLIVFFSGYMLNLDQSVSLPVALVFFSLALIGISLSHAQGNSEIGSWKQGYWSGFLLGSIGLIMVLGLAISLIINPGLIHLLIDALGWLWGLIERLFSFFAGLLPHSNLGTPPPLPTVSAPPPPESSGFHFPPWLTSGMKTVWIVIVLGLLAAALWQISSQIFGWMRHRTIKSGGERETLKGAFRTDFRHWLNRLISFILRITGKFGPVPKAIQLPPEKASVRQIYRQLLHWADNLGYPRLETQTPQEYQEALEDALEGDKEALAFITRVYMNARYGTGLPTEHDLNRLKETWHNLRQAGLKRPQTNKSVIGDESRGNREI